MCRRFLLACSFLKCKLAVALCQRKTLVSIYVICQTTKNHVRNQILIVPATSSSIKQTMRWPGIEPGSTAWKAAMLTTIPPTP